jgi:hypothetical protein
MGEQENPNAYEDSLDIVERIMAIEEALGDTPLSAAEREMLSKEIERRMASGEFGDELDDDALAALVRKIRPRGPRDQGAAARPEEPFLE